MRFFIIVLLVGLSFLSCKEKQKEMSWQHTQVIALDGVHPIGIAQSKTGFWLSDGDKNRVVLINQEGSIEQTIDSLDRPMHIDVNEDILMIPQYGNDEVIMISNGVQSPVKMVDSLDAPAGVSFVGEEVAVADFYNNQIHYSSNNFSLEDEDAITFGKEGKADGDFYYPTDVQITKNNIWVADAYNNRVQVFDFEGKHLSSIGKEEKMNAATGIYVSTSQLFVTDFEYDRVLVYDLEGKLVQEISEGLEKPTDLLIENESLYIANYKGKNLMEYKIN